ncbi:hypothetical protein [Mesorhizobium sp.]|uniref:hypothetical protein n=1 Tax=Mesorhizobium sp. TaxID=1871066 RepID=UPI002600A7A6|nr:hypothetical protein [Mesorhizobium sp.]
MHAPAGVILSCSYCSDQQGFFDVENVLVYNVGTGAFAASSRNGLTFERRRGAPPAAPDGRLYGRLSGYRFIPTPLSPEGAVISFVPERLSDPFHISWATTSVAAIAQQALRASAFSLHIDLRLPVLPKKPVRW